MTEKVWFPLESNPEIMNDYMEKLGMNTTFYSFNDVYSTEDWALDMIPRPVISVLLLFPISPQSEDFAKIEANRIVKDGQKVSSKVHFMKQTISNACGTIALLHSIANAHEYIKDDLIKPNSYLSHFLENTKSMCPEEIASYLEGDDELETTHGDAATEGQTEQTIDVDSHFICFSQVEGDLYELDGRKQFPINHGSVSSDQLLEKSCSVIKQFMERQPDELRFTIIALCKISNTTEE